MLKTKLIFFLIWRQFYLETNTFGGIISCCALIESLFRKWPRRAQWHTPVCLNKINQCIWLTSWMSRTNYNGMNWYQPIYHQIVLRSLFLCGNLKVYKIKKVVLGGLWNDTIYETPIWSMRCLMPKVNDLSGAVYNFTTTFKRKQKQI